LAEGSSNGSLTGVYLTGDLQGTTAVVSSYIISRCRISGSVNLTSTNSNFNFIENVLDGYFGAGPVPNCSFLNNIITATFNTNYTNACFNYSTFRNNIFIPSSYYVVSCQYSTFENNIFNGTVNSITSNVQNSIFNNNIFAGPINFPSNTNIGANNIPNQYSSITFVNQSGSTFNYTHDYHLQSSSEGKNKGSDGTDIGIYGGIYPWKAGSIPSNPHFQVIKVDPKTDAAGNLKVRIKVAAQNN
jgi:hypothetical protein